MPKIDERIESLEEPSRRQLAVRAAVKSSLAAAGKTCFARPVQYVSLRAPRKRATIGRHSQRGYTIVLGQPGWLADRCELSGLHNHSGSVAEDLGGTYHWPCVVANADNGVGAQFSRMRDHQLEGFLAGGFTQLGENPRPSAKDCS